MQELAIVGLLAVLLLLSTTTVGFGGDSILDLGSFESLDIAIPVKWNVALRFDRIFEFLFGCSPTP